MLPLLILFARFVRLRVVIVFVLWCVRYIDAWIQQVPPYRRRIWTSDTKRTGPYLPEDANAALVLFCAFLNLPISRRTLVFCLSAGCTVLV